MLMLWIRSLVNNTKHNICSGGVAANLNLKKFDIIPDDPGSLTILDKINKKWQGKNVADIAWSGKPFGLRTFYFDRNKSYSENKDDSIPCLWRNRNTSYVKKETIKKNADKIDEWKVCIPNAYGGQRGDRRITLPTNQIFLLPKGWIATETYNVVGSFKSKKEAETFIKFLQTDIVRYLLGLRKITQHIPRERWAWVPYLNMDIEWTDEKIATFFKFTKEEVDHIKKKVQEWS